MRAMERLVSVWLVVPMVAAAGPVPGPNGNQPSRPVASFSRSGGTNQNVTGPDGGREPLDASQTLGIGDRVSFRVLEDREEAKSLTITDAGQLDVPELGLVVAVGKTCKDLAQEIESKLEQ